MVAMTIDLDRDALVRAEESLTPEQKAWAFRYVEANGWPRGSNPPMYVWGEAFTLAKRQA